VLYGLLSTWLFRQASPKILTSLQVSQLPLQLEVTSKRSGYKAPVSSAA